MTYNFVGIDLSAFDSVTIRRIEEFCGALLTALNALESAMRQLHPPLLPKIAEALEPFYTKWDTARKLFEENDFPEETVPVIRRLTESGVFMEKALNGLIKISTSSEGIGAILTALSSFCRVQELIYPMHSTISSINRYFLEEPIRNRIDEYNAQSYLKADRGLMDISDSSGGRNGYHLYVPETWDGCAKVPLVVALHGGSGNGRDFIWMWLRETRSRKFILLAPGSTDRTWSFNNRVDADKIFGTVEHLAKKYAIPESRMLLTGFSDGAIYTLTMGLLDDSPFNALAPISGVLHPYNLHNAKNKRIFLVHGSLDWMFPVHHAKHANAVLKASGADITFLELNNLSHTYPRESNGQILEWFDPLLSLDIKS